MRDRLSDAAINQGYTPDGGEMTERRTDHKESYEHRRYNNDRCPSDEDLKGFRSFMDGFYTVCPSMPPWSSSSLTLIRNSTPSRTTSFELWPWS
jgi:hypothetical protein